VHDHLGAVDRGIDAVAGEQVALVPARGARFDGVIALAQCPDPVPRRLGPGHHMLAQCARRPGDQNVAGDLADLLSAEKVDPTSLGCGRRGKPLENELGCLRHRQRTESGPRIWQ
jgi:hypothetical protein